MTGRIIVIITLTRMLYTADYGAFFWTIAQLIEMLLRRMSRYIPNIPHANSPPFLNIIRPI